MSTVVKANDKAVLAAQAQNGQAGVEAYEQAQQAVKQARKQQTADALAAAQGRGAPAGAQQAAMADTGVMYDRRDAALATSKAAYQDAMAARQARMQDYNQGIGEARGLIADQAAQAVAPIDAQTRFAVSGIEARGRQTVDQIEAQMRLKELEMQAAAAAAARRGGGGGGGGGGGSKKKPKLGDTDLKAMLASGSGGKMAEARAAAQQALKNTQAEQRQGAIKAAGGNVSMSNIIRQSDRAAAARKVNTAPRTLPAPSAPGSHTLAPGEYDDPWTIPGAGVMFGSTVVQDQAAQRDAREAQEYADSLIQNYQDRRMRFAPLMADSRQSMFSPGQLDQLGASNPDLVPLFDAMFASNQPIRSNADIDRTLMGDPNAITPVQAAMAQMTNNQIAEYGQPLNPGTMPSLSPIPNSARTAQNEAMILAAIDLAEQGYEITEADVRNAIGYDNAYEMGDTAYDIQQRQQGQLPADEQIAEDAERMDEAGEKAEISDREDDEAARRALILRETNGISPEQIDSAMDQDVMAEIVLAENFTQAKNIAADLASQADDEDDWFELMAIEAQETNSSALMDPNLLAILRAINYG